MSGSHGSAARAGAAAVVTTTDARRRERKRLSMLKFIEVSPRQAPGSDRSVLPRAFGGFFCAPAGVARAFMVWMLPPLGEGNLHDAYTLPSRSNREGRRRPRCTGGLRRRFRPPKSRECGEFPA